MHRSALLIRTIFDLLPEYLKKDLLDKWIWTSYWITTLYAMIPKWNKNSYFVVGYPRSGTNFMCMLLADCLGIPVNRNWQTRAPSFFPCILHLHRLFPGKLCRKRTVFVLRDSRDVCVSFYLRSITQSERNQKVKKTLVKYLGRDFRNAETSINLPLFIKYMYELKFSTDLYRDHIKEATRKDSITVKYEDLLLNGGTTLRETVKALTGRDLEMPVIDSVLKRNSFEAKQKRAAGDERKELFGRKGIIGDWKNYFDRESAHVFNNLMGDCLIKMGYEKDSAWVDELE